MPGKVGRGKDKQYYPKLAYKSNRSVDDAIFLVLHTALEHLDRRDTYDRRFTDESPVFNTIIPWKLALKLQDLGLGTTICNWIMDLLMGRPRMVKIDYNTSSTLFLNTRVAQGLLPQSTAVLSVHI